MLDIAADSPLKKLMKHHRVAIKLLPLFMVLVNGCGKGRESDAEKRRPTPSISTQETQTRLKTFSDVLTADGPIEAWQEVSVSNQTNGLAVTEILVGIGDYVKEGQVLAKLDSKSVVLEHQQMNASVKEAQVHLVEAKKKANGARSIGQSGALSDIEQSGYENAELIAAAQLDSAQAQLASAQLKLEHTRITAPAEGLVISKSAVLGAIHPLGQEMFKLIRGNRIEWRAELTPEDLSRVSQGDSVEVHTESGGTIQGTVRLVAPSLNNDTRRGLIYVDLPNASGHIVPGSYVTGQIHIGYHEAKGLPDKAVCIKNNATFAFQILPSTDEIHQVRQTPVETGLVSQDWLEIRTELPSDAAYVANGACFLHDEDYVRVVQP